MATIKEVADRAGVSVATVSRVVNKSGYVSEALQSRVQLAMDALQYRPSALARGLRRQQSQTIGVLVPQLDQPFFSALAFALEKTLFAGDYRVLICSSEESSEKEEAYVEMLIRQRIDGCVCVPTGRSPENVPQLLESNIPVVLVDRDIPGLAINRVLCDNRKGAVLAAQHLIELGHRHVAVVGGPEYSEAIMQRMEGARRAFADANLPPPITVLSSEMLQFDMGYSAGLQLLANPATRPTAIFALTDVVAVGVIHAAGECGLAIPNDLSVIGFDDIPLASHIFPQLTTISQPIYRMGEAAAQILMRRMTDSTAPLESVILEARLTVRASTARCSDGEGG